MIDRYYFISIKLKQKIVSNILSIHMVVITVLLYYFVHMNVFITIIVIYSRLYTVPLINLLITKKNLPTSFIMMLQLIGRMKNTNKNKVIQNKMLLKN